METQSKTAEKIKHFIDQVDARVQRFDNEIEDLVSISRMRYHRELKHLKEQAQEFRQEAKDQQEARINQLKDSYYKLRDEADAFTESHLDPLRKRIKQLKKDAASYSDEFEHKWQEVKQDLEELLQTTKLAFQNFKDTFSSAKKH